MFFFSNNLWAYIAFFTAVCLMLFFLRIILRNLQTCPLHWLSQNVTAISYRSRNTSTNSRLDFHFYRNSAVTDYLCFFLFFTLRVHSFIPWNFVRSSRTGQHGKRTLRRDGQLHDSLWLVSDTVHFMDKSVCMALITALSSPWNWNEIELVLVGVLNSLLIGRH